MKEFNLYLTETLQRQFEIEADTEDEALKVLEQKYNDGEIFCDYDDLVDVEFSNCPLSKAEILLEKYRKEKE